MEIFQRPLLAHGPYVAYDWFKLTDYIVGSVIVIYMKIAKSCVWSTYNKPIHMLTCQMLTNHNLLHQHATMSAGQEQRYKHFSPLSLSQLPLM